jgi:uncharacterized protein with von Willebrand factor type A (vWA) domain
MKRLIRDVSRWNLYLGRESLSKPYARSSDGAEQRLADEVFDRLYAGEAEDLPVDRQDATHGGWARDFHAACEAFPAFKALAQSTRGDVLAAASATDAVIKQVRAAMEAAAEEAEKQAEQRREEKQEQGEQEEQGDDQDQDGDDQDGEQGESGDEDGEGEGEGEGEQGDASEQGEAEGQGGESEQEGEGSKGEGQGQGQGGEQAEGQGSGQGESEEQGEASEQESQGGGAGQGQGSEQGQGRIQGGAPKLGDRKVDTAKLKAALAKAVEAAQEAVEETRDQLEGVEGVGLGAGRNGVPNFKALAQLSERLKNDEVLKKIAKLAGKFRRIAAEKRKAKAHHGTDAVADVEAGAEVARLIPSELLKLADPELANVLARDLAERQAMQYRVEGETEKGRGPLLVLLDKSGSMKEEGRREWSAAVALALLDTAREERRPFILNNFKWRVSYRETVLPGEMMSEQGLLEEPSSGTSIDCAVADALNQIEEARRQKTAFGKADVILITDGEDDAGNAAQLRARAQELGVNIFGIGIGIPAEALLPWCDRIRAVEAKHTRGGELPEELAQSLFGDEVVTETQRQIEALTADERNDRAMAAKLRHADELKQIRGY